MIRRWQLYNYNVLKSTGRVLTCAWSMKYSVEVPPDWGGRNTPPSTCPEHTGWYTASGVGEEGSIRYTVWGGGGGVIRYTCIMKRGDHSKQATIHAFVALMSNTNGWDLLGKTWDLENIYKPKSPAQLYKASKETICKHTTKLVRTPSKIRQHAHGMVWDVHMHSNPQCVDGGSFPEGTNTAVRGSDTLWSSHTPQHWIRKHRNSITTEHTITAVLRMNAYMQVALV